MWRPGQTFGGGCWVEWLQASAQFDPILPCIYASGSFGCQGVMTPSHWFQPHWRQSWVEVDITTKVLLLIVAAAAVWGRLWNYWHICFHLDNLAVVAITCKRLAKNRIAHHLLRCFYFYAAFYCFQYSIEHVPGVLNTAADALSCNNLPLFSSLVSQASQTAVDTLLEELLITQRPDLGSAQWIWLFKGTLPML